MENYNTVSLFTDVEDVELRDYNRAQVMSNIFEASMDKEKKITAEGLGVLMQYFKDIPAPERKGAFDKFSEVLESKGLKQLH